VAKDASACAPPGATLLNLFTALSFGSGVSVGFAVFVLLSCGKAVMNPAGVLHPARRRQRRSCRHHEARFEVRTLPAFAGYSRPCRF